MHDRSLLGAADLPDDELVGLVARLLRLPADELAMLSAVADVWPYDLPALTTAGRYRVHGRVRTPDGERGFAFFVKVLQSWARSPLFGYVPEEHRERALALLPWQVEADVYRSDLAAALPDGLAMPRCLAVVDLDEDSAALWLEPVDALAERWDARRLARAARALGRLTGSAAVAGVSRHLPPRRTDPVRGYAEGRLAGQVLPALRDPALWEHPLVAGAFDGALRADLLAAADAVPAAVEELAALPSGSAHGDACTRNLLVPPDSDGFVLIDFGFWGTAPLGFDLGQLVVGEVQTGERPAAQLPALEAACLPAYVDGLQEEGVTADAALVERAHALQMLLFCALSAVPLEHLAVPPGPELRRVARERAALARFVLDLVHATA